MPNVKDIAKAAGVSPAAVSYVLNNRLGEVSADTRIRVMKAVRELGYRPKPQTTPATSTRADTIGLVLMHDMMTTIRSGGYFPQILDGVLRAASDRYIATTIFTLHDVHDVHTSVRSRLDGRCDGILLITPPSDHEIAMILTERGTPIVLVTGQSDVPGVVSVDVDDCAAARLAVEHLIALGHRRIAHLSGQREYAHARSRLKVYKDMLAAALIPFDERFTPEGTYLSLSGTERAMTLMRLPENQRPTAFFCGNDEMARGAIIGIKSLGFRVPEDVSVIGIDDADFGKGTDPPLTSVSVPLSEVGYRATEVLLDLIAQKPTEERIEIGGCKLVLRQSTAPPRQS